MSKTSKAAAAVAAPEVAEGAAAVDSGAVQAGAVQTDAVQAAEPTPVQQPVPGKRCAVAYVGPSLPRGQLTHNSLYLRGELPAHVQALVSKCPALGVLMVPVTDLAAVQRKLSDAGSMEAAKAKEIKAFFAKGEV